MATDTLNDFNATNLWQDIVATTPTSASIDLLLRNIGTTTVQVVLGGAAEPAATVTGTRLSPGGDVYVNNAHLWVRSYGAAGQLSVNPL